MLNIVSKPTKKAEGCCDTVINFIKKIKKPGMVRLLMIVGLLLFLPILLNGTNFIGIEKQYAQGGAPAGVYGVYGRYSGTLINPLDSLATGWNATIRYGGPTAYDLCNKAPTYIGTCSISYTVTAPWDELHLIGNQTIDTTPYIYLTFYARSGIAGQRFGVILVGNDNNQITGSSIVPIDSFGGAPSTAAWTVYNIPMTAFNSPTRTITGIGFVDLNGGTQNVQPPPATYFDEINFSQQIAEDIPQTSSGVQITNPTDVPTPAMPYYPTISPWVYIIPGLIIMLAIIFQ